jgi:hypothetical protein
MHGPRGLRARDGSPVLHPLALPDGPHLALTIGAGPAVTSSVILSCTIPGVAAPGEGTVTQMAQRIGLLEDSLHVRETAPSGRSLAHLPHRRGSQISPTDRTRRALVLVWQSRLLMRRRAIPSRWSRL